MSDKPCVLVTGAAGHLGSHLIPQLVTGEIDVLGVDIIEPSEPPSGWDFRAADLKNVELVMELLAGVDLIVHCASLHPWKSYTDDEYLDNNIKGTWHLYRAAAETGVGRVVLTSSIAAMGYLLVPGDRFIVTEDDQFPITDLYGITKHVQEDIARGFAATGKVHTIALRPPAFMPRPPLETAMRLTTDFAVVADVAGAHVAAVETLLGRREPAARLRPFEALFATNSLPFSAEDAALLGPGRNNLELARKHWPSEVARLVGLGFQGHTLHAVFDLERAHRLLGWTPKVDLPSWMAQHSL